MARIPEVDMARGAAVAMMIAYHLMFDMWYLGSGGVDIYALPLVLLQRSIGFLFVFLAGVSITLSERRAGGKAGGRHLKRALVLAATALAITAATWVYPHDAFITFGIIHFMAFAALAGPLFQRLGGYNVLLGAVLVAAGMLAGSVHTDIPWLFPLGITTPGYRALDFYPILPWFGITLAGIAAGQALYPEGVGRFAAPGGRLAGALSFVGRNSLAIYLLHQPVLMGALLACRELVMA